MSQVSSSSSSLISSQRWSQPKVLLVTALVTGLLALFVLGSAYIFKGVSILPYQYTKGLERIYGLFSLSLQVLSLFLAAAGLIVGGLAALSYLCSERAQRSQPRQENSDVELLQAV